MYYSTYLFTSTYVLEYNGNMQRDTTKSQLLLDMLKSGASSIRQIKQASTFNAGITRRGFLVAQKAARDFMGSPSGHVANKMWVTMPGLRGIGKTTILAQLFDDVAFEGAIKIYASFDRVKTVGADIQDFITASEAFMGCSFEEQHTPIVFFLDEVQYLDDWAVGLKTVLDRSNKIFIFCTGSSALSLQTDANVARRMDVIKLHPLCFTEYVMIKQAHEGIAQADIRKPIPGVSLDIKNAIFNSASAEDCYSALSQVKPRVNEYWSSIPYNRNALFGEYLAHGTLPFTLDLPNTSMIWDRINRILSESLDRDVMAYKRFDNPTVATIPQLLFLLAASVEVSVSKLARTLSSNDRTIKSVLSALEKTEIITAIPPKGASHGHIGKPSKYLFTSPAMRAALCGFGGVITPESDSSLRGKLLEDVVGLYLKRMFLDAPLTRAIVEYDPSQGGADFIVSSDGVKRNSVVIEVGANKTTSKQVIQTMNDMNAKYGIIITSGKLEVDAANNVARVPFEYFFLT